MHASKFLVGLTCVSGLLLASAAPAAAGAGDRDAQSLRRATAQRVVMQCEADASTRRAFTREHGSQPVFVTAREARAAMSAGEVWNAPRCMTAREHARLVQAMSQNASVR